MLTSPFCVILAEKNSFNLQYMVTINLLQCMVADLKFCAPSHVFALLFKLLELKLAHHNKKIHANYNKTCMHQASKLFCLF